MLYLFVDNFGAKCEKRPMQVTSLLYSLTGKDDHFAVSHSPGIVSSELAHYICPDTYGSASSNSSTYGQSNHKTPHTMESTSLQFQSAMGWLQWISWTKQRTYCPNPSHGWLLPLPYPCHWHPHAQYHCQGSSNLVLQKITIQESLTLSWLLHYSSWPNNTTPAKAIYNVGAIKVQLTLSQKM